MGAVVARAATGVAAVDDVLRALVDLLDVALPGRIRARYLGGSYGDESAVVRDNSTESSGLDVYDIFRRTASPAELATFRWMVDARRLLSPVALDAHAYCEDDLLRPPRPESQQASLLTVLVKSGGALLYADDVRAELPDVPLPRDVLDLLESAIFHLGIPRQRSELAYPLQTPLDPPLAYPDPDGECSGYDVVPALPGSGRGTRVLVAMATGPRPNG